MSKFIIEFDEEKQECPFHIVEPLNDEIDRFFTSRYCQWLDKKCDGWYKKDGWNKCCPLMKVKEVNHHCDDRPDCVGMKFPKVYEEVDYA